MKRISVDIEGARVSGFGAITKGTLWMQLDGEIFTVDLDSGARSSRRGRSGASQTHPGEVMAPMPGKIVKILVGQGEAVVEHQVLLVMEAMKMEYTLKAQAAGTVTSVKTAAGDQVALGQLLIHIET